MDAAQWDARYASEEYVWRVEPNVSLAREAAGQAPGRALELAGAGVAGLVVERAGTVERSVAGADRPALDCLVRVRREGAS